MAWEQRGRQQFYYRSRKVKGCVVREYYGRGIQAHKVAQEDARRRALREHAQAEKQRLQRLDTHLTKLTNVAQILVKAALLSAGFHQHKRVWRRKRRYDPRIQEGEENLMHNDRLTIESRPFDTLENLVQMAQQGDSSTLPAIRQFLDQVPALWEDSRILAQQVERTWLTTLCGQDLVSQEVIEREVQALRRQLLGANPSPLESLLVDRICACWLAVQHAEIHAAKRLTTHSVALSTAQEQRLDKVHRRFLTAIRELARVRKLLRPETKFQVNIGAQQIVS